MKANNLTISIDAPCNKNCPFCISNMTFYPESNKVLFERNMWKAHVLATMASVNSVLITSKGEPTLNLEMVKKCCGVFHDFPLEIQISGTAVDVETFYIWGINTVAFSISRYKEMFDLEKRFIECNKKGINVRVTIVLSDLWHPPDGYNFLADCNQLGIKQVTLRTMSIPTDYLETGESIKTMEWIKAHNNIEKNLLFYEQLRTYEKSENLVRNLPFGPSVYSMEGIAVTTIPYCIQESNNSEDIRSLIYHQDGHMYTSWDKPASILF